MTLMDLPYEDPAVLATLYQRERARREQLERELASLLHDHDRHFRAFGDLQASHQQLQDRLREVTELNATIFRLNGVLFRLYEEKERLATVDDLTGLYNHRFLREVLPNEIRKAQRLGYSVGLLIVDLDSFKLVNDSFGHLRGDEILRSAAQAIGRVLRRSDIVGRYGGEEFVAILPGCQSESAAAVAEKVRLAVAKARLGTEAGGAALTASIGAAAFPADGSDADSLLRRADDALYEAKRSGKNRVCAARSPNNAISRQA